MAISQDAAQQLGQLGSVFLDASGAASPPTGKVFVAITFLADTVFDASGGLVADTTNTASLGLEYAGTEAAARALPGGARRRLVADAVGLLLWTLRAEVPGLRPAAIISDVLGRRADDDRGASPVSDLSQEDRAAPDVVLRPAHAVAGHGFPEHRAIAAAPLALLPDKPGGRGHLRHVHGHIGSKDVADARRAREEPGADPVDAGVEINQCFGSAMTWPIRAVKF